MDLGYFEQSFAETLEIANTEPTRKQLKRWSRLEVEAKGTLVDLESDMFGQVYLDQSWGYYPSVN